MSYKYPAWIQMETALQCYEEDRQAELKLRADALGPEGMQQLGVFNKAADSLVKGAQELSGVELFERLAELAKAADFQQTPVFDLLDEHVCVVLGKEVMGLLSTANERFYELLMLLKDRKPCDRAKAFLQRVARCYLFGFDSECVVMCRAVLDREFDELVINDDQVSDWWQVYQTTTEGRRYRGRKPPYGKLWAKIRVAEHSGMIDEDARKAADAVRERGNDAVHKTPDKGDAIDAVRQAVHVLDALENAKGL